DVAGPAASTPTPCALRNPPCGRVSLGLARYRHAHNCREKKLSPRIGLFARTTSHHVLSKFIFVLLRSDVGSSVRARSRSGRLDSRSDKSLHASDRRLLAGERSDYRASGPRTAASVLPTS